MKVKDLPEGHSTGLSPKLLLDCVRCCPLVARIGPVWQYAIGPILLMASGESPVAQVAESCAGDSGFSPHFPQRVLSG